jgi:hypothetical protein
MSNSLRSQKKEGEGGGGGGRIQNELINTFKYGEIGYVFASLLKIFFPLWFFFFCFFETGSCYVAPDWIGIYTPPAS